MHVITSKDGLLETLPGLDALRNDSQLLVTGLPEVDQLCPGAGFSCGAVHEVLSGTANVRSYLMPALIARAASHSASLAGWIAWCDLTGDLYPNALAALGVPMERLLILRPPSVPLGMWAMTECLRSRGIAACIAPVGKISRVQARRFQLAAEHGGGIGVVLRSIDAVNWPYAAVTRWKVTPARGERMIQRTRVELIHGHGGRVGQSVLLEMCRETNTLRAAAPLVNRSDQAKTGT